MKVVDVLPNGNMVVEGQLHTAFSGEKQDAIVRGTVRPDDVMANNTLYSYNIADATIQFMSKGTITDAQRKGWLTRVWDKVSSVLREYTMRRPFHLLAAFWLLGSCLAPPCRQWRPY